MEDKWLEAIKEGKLVNEKDVKMLCEKVKEILIEESNVQPVKAPVVICGDIHGQFYDGLELFRNGGEIPNSRYVFMGDYVDRGYNSIETLIFLLTLKLKYPGHITLLRGNHESRQICFSYGFYEEINRKYGNPNAWKYFNDLFDYLPLGALIEGKIGCIHGGGSPMLSTIDQIRLINRRQEIPHDGPFCDLMWSDPDDIETWLVSNRGAGYGFGWKVVKEFNFGNGINLVCRAHQLVNEGFKYWFNEQTGVTVWSAPNYCYRCLNKASILQGGENLERTFKIFSSVPESAASKPPKSCVPYFG